MVSRPLRIGITCYPSVGGSGILASALGESLALRGHEVHFIAYERPFRMPLDAPRVFFHPVAINDYELFRYPDYTLPLSVKMAEVSAAHRLDILHVHYAVPHATAALLARSMLPEEQRPRVVATLHGTDTTLLGKDPAYAPAIRHALEAADAVTAVSDFLRTETIRVIGVRRPIDVIHNFFEPRVPTRPREAIRQELGVEEDETLLLHLSNLRPVKRIPLLLESVAALSRELRYKLLILSGGDFAPFEEQVRQLGLQERLVVLNNVLEVDNYLQAADLGFFTSETESFCLSLLEVMAFGIPGVSTRVGGIPEVVEHGINGLLEASATPRALAAQLERLIRNPEERQLFGTRAQRKARGAFSAETIVPRYEALYRRLV